jgi:23S rRNA (pseudouridine1915-N3)-methyltransferase
MNITLILIGKTDQKYLQEGISVFERRIKRYVNFEIKILPDVKRKNISHQKQKEEEAKLILNQLPTTDKYVILFDEYGKELNSVDFSLFLEKRMISGVKNLVFIVGGPYGFAKEIYDIATIKLSLSRMTFSHQMVRLIIVEQIYRAFTILNNEPYHHE